MESRAEALKPYTVTGPGYNRGVTDNLATYRRMVRDGRMEEAEYWLTQAEGVLAGRTVADDMAAAKKPSEDLSKLSIDELRQRRDAYTGNNELYDRYDAELRKKKKAETARLVAELAEKYPVNTRGTFQAHSIGGREETVVGTVIGHNRGSVELQTDTHGTVVVPVEKFSPIPKTTARQRATAISGGMSGSGVTGDRQTNRGNR